jgi:lysophospholipid acyltransferase (LPLAT)-like uncharacterized protein
MISLRIRKSAMKFKDFLYEHLYPALADAVMRAICRTLRIETRGEERVDSLRQDNKRLVYSFWHGRHFLLAHYMGGRNILVMVSPSRDGRLIANILIKSGIGVVSGSSHRNPVRALVEAIQKMKAGSDIGFTVDGPKGPIHKVKPGAIYLAKKMQAHILPLTVGFKDCWTLKSWDSYQIPKPFTRAVILFGEPYQVNADLSEAEIEKSSIELENKLNQISAKADELARE